MCAVDLTRSIASKSVKAAAAKKLAFSVENILDPTKFCSRQEKFNARHWPQGYDGDDRLDDEHSDCQSSKSFISILSRKFYAFYFRNARGLFFLVN